MKNRLPSLLLALGLLIVALYPRVSVAAGFPPFMRTDLFTGTVMGVGIGLELAGAIMMIKRPRSRCRRAA